MNICVLLTLNSVSTMEHLLGLNVQRLTRPSIKIKNLCSGFDTSASQGAGAAYSWCQRALQRGASNAHSFGIYNFDRWSQTLSNSYGFKTTLYDCFATEPLTGAFGKYKKPYVRHNVCLGGTDAVIDNRQFISLNTALKNHSLLSAFVKMDIEGYEWQVLLSTSPADFAKIILLDLELHWCAGPANPSKMKARWEKDIVKVLRILKRYFFVTDRTHGRKNMSYAATGCVDVTKIYTMMSISYVNRNLF